MGESIPNMHCCQPKPEDRYVIGEFVGVRTFYSENYSLSFIRTICADGFLECAGMDQASSMRVSSQAVCKIQQTVLREILRYLMAEKRLSLPYAPSLSTDRLVEREGFPRLGEQVSEVNRRPLQEGEAFLEGELVAVLEVPVLLAFKANPPNAVLDT